MKLLALFVTIATLAGCATPAENLKAMMDSAGAEVTAARAAGKEVCLVAEGIIGLSNNPFVSADVQIKYRERTGSIECP